MKKKNKIIILLISLMVTLSSCSFSFPGLGATKAEDGIIVTSGSNTENQILGYIVSGMIEYYTGEDVNLVNNLATSTLNHQALLGGDANISAVRYVGTSITGELQMDPIKDPDLASQVVKREFKDRFDQKYYDSFGFGDTYAFMVTRDFQKKYGVKKISDLEDLSQKISVGVDNSWLKRKGDGYEDFKKTYGFSFPEIYPMQIGLVYSALESGEFDCVLGYSTDGRIKSYDLVVLEDDKGLFPPYDACPLATYDVLRRYPDLDKVFEKLQGTISMEKMQELNYLADDQLESPWSVANRFLEDNNYFYDKEPIIERAEL